MRNLPLIMQASDLWYKHAIIYCLDVGRFQDGNGDGEGDFTGLIERLDYLAGLGVNTVWLMPFLPSPDRDDGYDVTDYYGVDPRHGSLGDFVHFMHEAHDRGLRVLIDLVVNHTSIDHPWFQAARRGDPRFRDFYYWSKEEPPSARQGMVFPGVQERTWTFDPVAQAYYFHRFHHFQPDLRTENPEVLREIEKMIGFWLKLGVSGFRVDAVPFLIETIDEQPSEEQRFEFLRELRRFLQWRTGNAIMLAEANIQPEEADRYFGADTERMHMLFNFPVNQRLFYALATADTEPLVTALEQTRRCPSSSQWAVFLRNHDELDLGRLPDAQREACFRALGPDPDMQLYGRGIRRRLAPMLNGDRRRIELALALLFGLPGTPVIYYGDELGMGDDLGLPDRLAVRTAMQWSPEPHGGFTSAEQSRVPIVEEGPFGYRRVNVAEQLREPKSLLNTAEHMIRMRKLNPELGCGMYDIIPGPPGLLTLLHTTGHGSVLTAFNFSDQECSTTIELAQAHGAPLTSVLDAADIAPAADGRYCLTLPPYGYRWYRLAHRAG